MTKKTEYTNAWRTACNAVAMTHRTTVLDAIAGNKDLLYDLIPEALCLVADLDPLGVCAAIMDPEGGYIADVDYDGWLHHIPARIAYDATDMPSPESMNEGNEHVFDTYVDGVDAMLTDVEAKAVGGTPMIAAVDVTPGTLREHGRSRVAVTLYAAPAPMPMVIVGNDEIYTVRAALCAALGDRTSLQEALVIRSVVAPAIGDDAWARYVNEGYGVNEWLVDAMVDCLTRDDSKGGDDDADHVCA